MFALSSEFRVTESGPALWDPEGIWNRQFGAIMARDAKIDQIRRNILF